MMEIELSLQDDWTLIATQKRRVSTLAVHHWMQQIGTDSNEGTDRRRHQGEPAAAARTLLESQGYSVESAENGLQALDQVRSAPPDLIISDLLMMPEMDGYPVPGGESIERLSLIPFVFTPRPIWTRRMKRWPWGLGASLLSKPTEPLEFLRLVNRSR